MCYANPKRKAKILILAFVAVIILSTTDRVKADRSVVPRIEKTDNDGLIISTQKYEACFEKGVLVHFTNKLTGESYFCKKKTLIGKVTGIRRYNNAWVNSWTNRHTPTEISCDISRNKAQIILTKVGKKNKIVMTLEIDPRNDDLIIRVHGQSTSDGVHSIAWGISGLNDKTVKLVLPAYEGIAVDGNSSSGTWVAKWPAWWHAQLAIVQGVKGGMKIWSTDTQSIIKSILYGHSCKNATFQLSFRSENPAPWKNLKNISSVEWRLNAYEGDWTIPAGEYRDWMHSQKAFDAVRLSERTPSWTKDIRTIITMPLNTKMLKELKRYVYPRQTLIFLPHWTKEQFRGTEKWWQQGCLDACWPACTPSQSFMKFLSVAHSLGFRVMVHANFQALSTPHPLYKQKGISAHLLKNRFVDKPASSFTTKDKSYIAKRLNFAEYDLFLFNLASDYSRKILIDEWHKLYQKTKIDALFLDYPALLFNDPPLDGRNSRQGAQLLLAELRKRIPSLAIGAESRYNELFTHAVSFSRNSSLRMNKNEKFGQTHPIVNHIYYPYMKSFTGTVTPGPAPDFIGYLDVKQRIWNRLGVIPSPVMNAVCRWDMQSPGTIFALSEAKFWQTYRLEPFHSGPWKSHTKYAYKTKDGRIAAYRKNKFGGEDLLVRKNNGEEEIAYRTFNGVGRIARNGYFIPSWIGYNEQELIGLNPKRKYVLLPGEPDRTAPAISSISDGTVIDEIRSDDERLLLRLEAQNGKQNVPCKFTLLLPREAMQISFSRKQSISKSVRKDVGKEKYLYEIKCLLPNTICVLFTRPRPVKLPYSLIDCRQKKCGYVVRDVFCLGDFMELAELRMLTQTRKRYLSAIVRTRRRVIDYVLTLPDKKIFLDFGIGLMQHPSTSETIRFAIKIDGEKIFSTEQSSNIAYLPLRLDLSPYAGKTILLSLVTESDDPKRNSEKWNFCGVVPAVWFEPKIIEKE